MSAARKLKNKTADNALKLAELSGIVTAINRVQAVIEFNLDGTILHANDNFLAALGYSLDEIQNKHHRIFCEPDYTNSLEYRRFWEKLSRGEFEAGVYKRRGKKGNDVWINASYNPIFDTDGKPFKIVKFASDVTEQKNKAAEFESKITAVTKSQAMIEFGLDGIISFANDNFLSTLGYSLTEVQNQHHRMFVDPVYANSAEYKNFWEKLNRGQFDSGEYKRITKTGKEVWINASYNPIFDANGKLYKIVKFATDITKEKVNALEVNAKMTAVSKAQAIIEFSLDGTIIKANENFLKTMGYSESEIIGKHHRTFVDPAHANSAEYRAFWDKLNRGELDQGEYKRKGKDGSDVWINASYNPIFDLNGKPYKVVKFALDVTELAEIKRKIQSIEEMAATLAAASYELTATATQMAATATKTDSESRVASTTARDVSTGVQIVATNVEEMVASIKEIARSTNESSQMAKMTLEKARESNATVVKLGVSSQEIGDVIKVISSIAQQTNLLALNATIEAARAGEAGKGFAVVANEVKELAKQTAKATNDITIKIGAIQMDTQSAVSAIGGISAAVEKLNGIAGVIAVAVEEQTATTNEISRVVVQSKKGVESIAETISSVSNSANESTLASTKTLASSKDLANLAERLSSLVKRA